MARAVVVSLAVLGGVSFCGAGAVYANATVTHDENTKTTTVATGADPVVDVYGNSANGTSNPGAAEADGYTVGMSGGEIYIAYGGRGYNASSGDTTAVNNKANISGGTVSQSVYGGHAYGGNATAENNEVNISGEATVGSDGNYGGISGGRAEGSNQGTGTANSNKVTISDGAKIGVNNPENNIFGGYAYANGNGATAEKNTVNITGGTFSNTFVYGGWVSAANNTATATGNIVNIYGGSFTNSSTVYGAKVGGSTGIVKDNVINLWNSNMNLANLYLHGYDAAQADTVTHSGNTLNVYGKNITVKWVEKFDNVNFFLPADTASGDTMLTVKGTANLTGTTLGAAAQVGLNLEIGDTVNLLTTTGALNTDSELNIAASVTAPASISTDNKYTFAITKSGDKNIIATVTDKKVSNSDNNSDTGSGNSNSGGNSASGGNGTSGGSSTSGGNSNSGSNGNSGGNNTSGSSNTLPERTKSLAETMAGSISLLNGGMDMTVGQSFDNAAAAVEAEQSRGAEGQIVPTTVNGFVPFATIGGSNMRAKSGSYVDTKGWGIDVGFARELKNRQGKLLFGPLVGYGRGNYDSYLDNGVHGSGKTSFWSLGLIAKQVNHDGLYYEGSIRGGRVKSDYYSDNFFNGMPGMDARYDTSSNFFAAHLGIGKIFDLSHANKLDTYLKYYYTHQGGDRVAISSNIGPTQTFDFDSVSSSRLRLGMRFIHALNERQDIYTGLAYQYEFDGDARATYNGQSTPSPSIKGSSGMLELGFRTKVSSNMDIDLNVNGWTGKQRGVNAQLGMKWKF